MKQLVNIRKVSIDSELKVAVTIEFIAANQESKKNLFELIELQGDVVEASFKLSQQKLPIDGNSELAMV